MPLPSTGNQISLSQVNTELGLGMTVQISLNQTNVRSLFQKTTANSQIAMSDGWGKSACAAYGTYLTQYCSGYTLYYRYADGNCGYYDQVYEYNSPTCGYCDPYGTFLYDYCDGYTLTNVYANGSCGTYTQVAQYNSPTCGYCDPYGTFLYDYCNGYTLIYVYANGTCGDYAQVIEYNSPTCGYCDPYGTFLGTYCSGYDLYNQYANGNCGTYSTLNTTCADGCGCLMSINCYLHAQFANICDSFYIESNAATNVGTITSHGILRNGTTICNECGTRYDSNRQDYYYYYMGASPAGSYTYTCYSTNSFGKYVSATAGPMNC